MDRKDFINTSAFLGVFSLIPVKTSMTQEKNSNPVSLDLSDIPNFCGHEHCGSVFSLGLSSSGFTADLIPSALPARRTTLDSNSLPLEGLMKMYPNQKIVMLHCYIIMLWIFMGLARNFNHSH